MFNFFKWTYWFSCNDYSVATLSESYLTITGIIMLSLKSIGQVVNVKIVIKGQKNTYLGTKVRALEVWTREHSKLSSSVKRTLSSSITHSTHLFDVDKILNIFLTYCRRIQVFWKHRNTQEDDLRRNLFIIINKLTKYYFIFIVFIRFLYFILIM